jgi:hypothetical protein
MLQCYSKKLLCVVIFIVQSLSRGFVSTKTAKEWSFETCQTFDDVVIINTIINVINVIIHINRSSVG